MPHIRTVVIHCSALVALNVGSVCLAEAQTGTPDVTPATAAAVQRARTLADVGDGDKAHTLLDSLVAALPRESLDAGEALYWRALLSEQSPGAERDWKQLVVEIPQSSRVPDALLRLSELDITHNNSAIARQHAKRLLSDYPDAPQRARAMIVLAQSYFTDNDAPRACGVLTVVRKEAPLSAVEVRLRADEMQQQCRNVREVAMGASPDATPTSPMIPIVPPIAPATAAREAALRDAAARDAAARNAAARDSVAAAKAASARAAADARDAEKARKATIAREAAAKKAAAARAAAEARDSADAREAAAARQAEIANETAAARDAAAREAAAGGSATRESETRRTSAAEGSATHSPPTVPTSGRWTIQVAAYDARTQADALVKKLIANDLAAHTVGARKPFRVQVGRFETRADAMEFLTVLKTKGQNGFISEWAKR